MRLKKPLREYRHTSFRLEKELLTQFTQLCAQIGISRSTGLSWLIEEALQKKGLQPPAHHDGDGLPSSNQGTVNSLLRSPRIGDSLDGDGDGNIVDTT